MTIERLKQYRAMKRYIETADDEIETISLLKSEPYTSDSVIGSRIDVPYTKHSIGISGVGVDCRAIRRTRNRKAEYLREMSEIDDFIDSIEDIQLQQILHYKYRAGMTWKSISCAVCCSSWEGTARHIIKRFFKKM